MEWMLVTRKAQVLFATTINPDSFDVVTENGASATSLSSRGALVLTETDFKPEMIPINLHYPVYDYDSLTYKTEAKRLGMKRLVSFNQKHHSFILEEEFTPTDSTLEPETTTLASSSDDLTVASYFLYQPE